MILESVVVLVTLASGASLLGAVGLREWGTFPLGFIVGTAMITVVGTLQVAFSLPSSPVLTYLIPLVLGLGIWSVRAVTGHDVAFSRHCLSVIAAVAVPVVWLLRSANLVRVTPDSLQMVMNSMLMADGELALVSAAELEDWQVGFGAVHGIASLNGELYLRAATPLLAVATLLALYWLVARALVTAGAPLFAARSVAIASAALLASNPRFIYHAFYLNRHLVVAALVLAVASAAWGLMHGTITGRPALITIVVTCLPAVALGRPETPLVAALVLLPLLTSEALSDRERVWLLTLLGSVVALWHGSLVATAFRNGAEPSTAALLLAGFGIVGLVVAAGVRLAPHILAGPFPKWTLHATEVLLWAAVGAGALVMPDVFRESVRNTLENVVRGGGGWSFSLVVLAILACLVLVTTREDERCSLRFPLTTFLPLGLFLAYVRAPGGLAYRVATSDSFSRMLLHIVPLAIFYLATGVTARRRWDVPDSSIELAESSPHAATMSRRRDR